MKKEFKAPIVETKEFAAAVDVMSDIAILSTSGGNIDDFTTVTDADISDGFKIWKGIK